MREYDWLFRDDFRGMTHVLGTPPDPRKMRLAACECVRQVLPILDSPLLREAVNTAEQFADFQVNRQQLKAKQQELQQAIADRVEESWLKVIRDKGSMPDWVRDNDDADTWVMSVRFELPIARAAGLVERLLTTRNLDPDALSALADIACQVVELGHSRHDRHAQCHLLRDIFGNPFRPVAFDPAWRTDTAVSLAKPMYESREFTAMPILADALQDAGCENEDILTHSRDPKGVHVRGCWVVDLVLGKS